MSELLRKTSEETLFSIIIPIFNRAKHLPRLFASLSQIHAGEGEILLVDNGSTDNSLQLCHNFQQSFALTGWRVQVLVQEQPSASAARNLGATMAKGKYLYFFDSDDEFDSRFLQDAQPLIGTADLLCAPTLMVFPDATTKKRSMPKEHLLLGHLLAGSFSTQSYLVRRTFWEKVGGWDETLRQWDDWELGVRLLLHYPSIQWLSGTAYHRIYQHEQSQTGTPFAQSLPYYSKAFEAVATQLHRQSYFSKHEQSVLLIALCGKKLLLSAIAHRQGETTVAQQFSKEAFSALSGRTKQVFKALYHLDRCGLKALWRIYYLYCRLSLSIK